MKQEISVSEARLVAGGGLYDHLPGPIPPPPNPAQTSEEKRAILERLAGSQELIPGGMNGPQ